MQRYNIILHDKRAIEKLDSMGRKKGKYIEKLILNDIRFDLLESEVKGIKDKIEGRKPDGNR